MQERLSTGGGGEMRYVSVGTTFTVGTGVTGRKNLSRNYCLKKV